MSATAKRRETIHALLDNHGQTYAAQAGIRLRDTPQPLYQLLVLASLLSARIRASVAVGAARELFGANMRTPRRMQEATWQQRVDALGAGHYRRYDESTSTTLGKSAAFLRERYGGDLRRLRKEAHNDPGRMRERLQELPGIGPAGAAIFLREVQGIWTELEPCLDGKAVQGAQRLGLPTKSHELAKLVPAEQLTVFAAALVRAALDKSVVEDVRERTDTAAHQPHSD
ncbi:MULTISPECIES: endonuclease [unclassified Streptomyces]|uniref:endonuclease n=1 Tax=unclassified Streptomyces TaxID=2593676 RepID=UPI00093B5691|nr:endonuclease [Streptomyces sp. TSRI0281]OKI47137.1 endonuclease [Streptomyces sp. TSRI0281]